MTCCHVLFQSAKAGVRICSKFQAGNRPFFLRESVTAQGLQIRQSTPSGCRTYPLREPTAVPPYSFSNSFNGVVFLLLCIIFVGEAGDKMFIGGVKPR